MICIRLNNAFLVAARVVDYPISIQMVSSSYPPGLCFFLGTPRSACSYGSERQTRFKFQIIYFLL